MSNSQLLNDSQERRLRANAEHADELLSRIEEILMAAESKAAFLQYHPDVSVHQTKLIRNHIARFRTHLVRVLETVGITHEGPRFGALRSIRVTLSFVRVSVQEMAPGHLRGYGELSAEASVQLKGLCSELEGILDGLERNLAMGEEADLQGRLDRLQGTTRETELLRLLERITSEQELAEFRPPLLNLLEKLESRQFEIAVFGRVSSGKSSLLNHVLHTDVLPVGVNPITAVPTRIVFADKGFLDVTFADRKTRRLPLEDLGRYAGEEQNPGNESGVTKLVVSLPGPRLQKGLVLVDTPGLGALARQGAAETMAYLPQCDLGIVLISAASPINDEDLNTIHALAQAGIPAKVLLSKADLLSPQDLDKASAYIRKAVAEDLGLRIDVHSVSTVAGREQLSEAWFTRELEPLYRRHRELSQDSVRRKAGALREAVLTALRTKLGRGDSRSATDRKQLAEIENRLRQAAGSQEDARNFCLTVADEMRSLGDTALEKAAASVVGNWSKNSAAARVSRAVVMGAVADVAADAASRISGRLRVVAEGLDSALKQAAAELGDTGKEESLDDCVREMPRFEVSLTEFDWSAPWYSPFQGLVQSRLARKLKRSFQPHVDEAFNRYARALGAWSRQVLSDLQLRFDASADGYRAQLTRLTSTHEVSSVERDRIESFTKAESDAPLPGEAPPEALSEDEDLRESAGLIHTGADQYLDRADQGVEAGAAFLLQIPNARVGDLLPLRRQPGQIHENDVADRPLKMPLHPSLEDPHRQQEGEELPVMIEDVGHPDVGGARFPNGGLHLRRSQRDAQRLQRPFRESIPKILQDL